MVGTQELKIWKCLRIKNEPIQNVKLVIRRFQKLKCSKVLKNLKDNLIKNIAKSIEDKLIKRLEALKRNWNQRVPEKLKALKGTNKWFPRTKQNKTVFMFGFIFCCFTHVRFVSFICRCRIVTLTVSIASAQLLL